MKNKKYRKIIFVLILVLSLVFIGLISEFIIHRYTVNRSAAFATEEGRIRIYRDRRWQDFLFNEVVFESTGFNSAGEAVINKDTYARRIRELGETGVNLIRVNTIQPPAFYQAFFEYNMLTNRPVYLMHGILIEDLSMEYYGNAYEEQLIADFFGEIRLTVDVIYGKAVIRPEGNTNITHNYNLNVSPYVMGYLLCGEFNEDFIDSTNEKNTHVIGFEGDFFYTDNASPYEAWIAGVGNYAISYEQDKYRGSHKLICWIDPPSERILIAAEHILTKEQYNAGVFVFRDRNFLEPELLGFLLR